MDPNDASEASSPPPVSDDELIREAFLDLFGQDLLTAQVEVSDFDPSWATGVPRES